MSGIIHKIEETLHIGGDKKEGEHKGESHGTGGEHKGAGHHGAEHKPEEKEGFMDKIKEKIHGDNQGGHHAEGEKKKKKEKKKREGHEHGGGHDSSSSDSD